MTHKSKTTPTMDVKAAAVMYEPLDGELKKGWTLKTWALSGDHPLGPQGREPPSMTPQALLCFALFCFALLSCLCWCLCCCCGWGWGRGCSLCSYIARGRVCAHESSRPSLDRGDPGRPPPSPGRTPMGTAATHSTRGAHNHLADGTQEGLLHIDVGVRGIHLSGLNR